MATRHPDTTIIPYLRGDLDEAERARVGEHLAACADCRRASESFHDLFEDLAASAPVPPPVDWMRYRGQLRAKLAARAEPRRRSWWPPVPVLASAALASVLIFLAVGNLPRSKPADLAAVEEAMLGHRLELVQSQPLLERLDLFEDLEVIRNLGALEASQDG